MAVRLGFVALVLGAASPVGGLVLLAQDARAGRAFAWRGAWRGAHRRNASRSHSRVRESSARLGGRSIAPSMARPLALAEDDASVVALAEKNPISSWREVRNNAVHHLFQNLTFMHLPKNAGTAVEDLSYSHGILWGKYHPLFHGYKRMSGNWHCSHYHVPAPILQKHKSHSPYSKVHAGSVFCIVRHPYARIVSHYKFLMKEHKSPKAIKAKDVTCSEKSLNSYVEQTMRLVKHGNEYMEDCHLVPQAEFVWNEDGEKLCHHVLYMGPRLNRSFATLMKEYKYPKSMYALPESNGHGDICGNLGVDSLSNASIGLLDEVYAKDFKLLNFQRRGDR